MNTKRKTLKMPVRYLMNLVLVALLFVVLSFLTSNVLSTYQNKVLLTVGINIILAVSLNVATGYLGQLPLGHAGFMAVGAYACALFTKSSGLPKGVAFAIGLVLAWVVAGLFGVLIGIPALRLTGDYLAILTLGFGEIIRITLNNIDDVLGFKLFLMEILPNGTMIDKITTYDEYLASDEMAKKRHVFEINEEDASDN